MKVERWQWLIVVGGVLLAVHQGRSVWWLYKSGEQIQLVQEQLRQEEEKNEQLKRQLAEVDNPQFIEKEAREKLGYVRQGETLLLVPEQKADLKLQISNPGKSKPNWKVWWDLYIRL